MLAKRLNLVERNFSRLQSYYYARLQGGFPAGADTGCYVRDGVKAAVKYGFCPERLWRYDISKFSEEPSAEARSAALRNQVKLYSRCRGIPAIRMAIAEGYPVIGGFAVPENILSDECSRTGVIQFPSPNEAIIGGHAVLFVGYDNSKQLIKFQNSWGAGWGDGGCGYLPYRFVWSKLAMDFWALQSEEGKLSPGNL
jgi:C1A family cysteine protease